MSIIGEKIKERRLQLNMSQRDLAARLGYSNHSTVARVESGKIDLPQSRIVKFAEALGVSVSHLMGWDEEPETLGALAASVVLDTELAGLVHDYNKLDESERAAVRELVSRLAANKKD